MRIKRSRNRSRTGWLMMTSRVFEQRPKQVEAPPYTPGEKATCDRKRRYPDEVLARTFAAIMANSTEQGKLYVYRCKVCNGWHLTKRPNGTPATAADPFAVQNAA